MKRLKSKGKLYFLFIILSFGNLTLVFSQEKLLSSDFRVLVQSQGIILNVPYIQQPPNTQWCWAASAAMVLGSRGVNVQCEQVVMAVFHLLNPMQTGSEQNILQGLSYGGVDYRIVPGFINFITIKQIIDSGSPIIICYRGSFAGHAVVLVGYNINSGTVVIYDPVYGRFFNVPFGNSLTYGSMAGPLFWQASLIPY